MLWDLTDAKRLYTLEASDIIHALCFSPNRYWLCAATQACIKVGTHACAAVLDAPSADHRLQCSITSTLIVIFLAFLMSCNAEDLYRYSYGDAWRE